MADAASLFISCLDAQASVPAASCSPAHLHSMIEVEVTQTAALWDCWLHTKLEQLLHRTEAVTGVQVVLPPAVASCTPAHPC